ncbi:hypothetical protein BGW80DRAFT_1258831 [Lactifluus volemus]|nr:hypothetical protein BGW80DRAFT_1258831 [Lactifluus volemus]
MAMFHHGPEQEYILTTLKSHPYQQHASLGLVKPKMKYAFITTCKRLKRGSLRNHLHVSSLVWLIEERRDLDLADGGGGPAAARSQSVTVNVRRASSLLAEKYGMDVEKVERLVRFVNVPSVREGEKNVQRRSSGGNQ